jgi:dihydrofolate reductase
MKLILACDINGGIGYQGKLPWDRLPADLPRFKQLTEGGVVVMGSSTYRSLPIKPLPNRINFIVTSNLGFYPSCCFTIPNLDYIKGFNNAWIIGGAKLVNSNWDVIHEIHLSLVLKEYTCDTFIDRKIITDNFTLTHGSGFGEYSYEIYKRK